MSKTTAHTLNIALVAEEAAGVQTLRLLHRSGHNVVSVLSGARQARGATVADVAKGMGYSVWPAKLVKEAGFADDLRAVGTDLLLNVHSLYRICPEVLAAPRLGSFNLHPGPLPEYAGMNAPSWAIYRGEHRHGVSLHWMEAGIDTGDVAYADTFEISETDTGLTVAAACVRRGLPLIERLLDRAGARGDIPRLPQDLSRRRYFGREVPQQGLLDWGAPAGQIVDFVRAADYFPLPSPWGAPQSCVEGKPLGIMQAARERGNALQPPGTVGEPTPEGVPVCAADGLVLVRRVWWEERARPAQDVLRPGMRLG